VEWSGERYELWRERRCMFLDLRREKMEKTVACS
jgi:hypothetical protein